MEGLLRQKSPPILFAVRGYIEGCFLALYLAFGSNIWKDDETLQWTRAMWKQQCAWSCQL
jgi:hypothetical protein